MTLIQDADYWQEQIDRATEIRPTLERLFLLAHNHGLVQPTDSGTWQYVGKTETLTYDPTSDSLSAKANDDRWRIDYHEQAFAPQATTEISDEQLQSCRENKVFFDQQHIPEVPNLRSLVHSSSNEQADVLDTAAILFEQCAEAGMSADRNGSEWAYIVTVDDLIYLVSRDDVTGEYNVRNPEGTLDVQQSAGLSQRDVQIWENVDQFLVERPIESPITTADWSQTVWDRQCDRANSILSAMETLMSHRQNVDFDGIEYRTEPVEGYMCGYCPNTETRWLDRGNQRILTASNPEAHYDSDTSSWSLEGLEDIGTLTAAEANYFESLQLWLVMVDLQFQAIQSAEKNEIPEIASTTENERFAVPESHPILPTEISTEFQAAPIQTSETIPPPEANER